MDLQKTVVTRRGYNKKFLGLVTFCQEVVIIRRDLKDATTKLGKEEITTNAVKAGPDLRIG